MSLYAIDLTVASLCAVVFFGSLDGHADETKATSRENPATIVTSVLPEPPIVTDFRQSAGGPHPFDSVRTWQMYADRVCDVVGAPPRYDCRNAGSRNKNQR